MKLVYTSNPLSLVIEHYEPMSFEYNGWEITDEYEFCEEHPRISKYKIIVSSDEIVTEEKLNSLAQQGRELIELVTKLLPYNAVLSLNEPKYIDRRRTQSIIAIGAFPKGWSSNYKLVYEKLPKPSDDGCLKAYGYSNGYHHYAWVNTSPLVGIKVMLENYDNLSDSEKYLIFLHNVIIESEDSNRYMLIGKALEIVNAIYPYRRLRGQQDTRINDYHPELIPIFKDLTLKDLIDLSNNRQETRHFIKKADMPHPPLSMEEKEKLFTCSRLLITNIIRLKFGLEVLTFAKE